MSLIETKVDVEESYDAETRTIQRDTITTYLLFGLPIWRTISRENLKPVLNRSKPFRYR